MFYGKDIICISSIDWDFVWQGHQEIMSTFAKNGNRVLYIENTGVRAPRFSDIGRLRHRIANWRKGISGIRQESKNLFICSPLIAPFPYSRIAKLINRFLLINSIKTWMKAIDFKNPIIWTFLPTSISIDIIDNIDNSLAIYYCIAEFAELAGSSKKVERTEAELLKRCNVVFAQGEKIRERCLKYNKDVHIFPFGVKSDVFLKAHKGISQPEDIRFIQRPILGYIGGIHKHMNFKLLKSLSEKNPEASIVLVGPIQTEEIQLLRGIKNIHFLGKKKHSELPSYIDSFDLCLIPYLITEYTKTVYPTKLNEYLMRGKRVLSTPLPEVNNFVKTFGEVVFISRNENDFIEKAQNILSSPVDNAFSKRLIDVAGQNSWEKRIEKMSDLITVAMDKKQKETSGRWKDNFLRLARITKITRERIAVFVLALIISYAALFHTPFIWWVAKPLKITSALSKADAIVVLGGGVGESGRPGQGYEERVKYAAQLYKNGYAKKLIFSSGFVYALQEADVMKALAVSLGIPARDIILEKKAGNTYENVKYTLSIADKKGYHRFIFVSSPYHMRRLKLVSEKLAGDKDHFIFSPIPYSLFYGDGTHTTLKHIKAIIHEYAGIVYYFLNGWI